jgi:hypothetical protein
MDKTITGKADGRTVSYVVRAVHGSRVEQEVSGAADAAWAFHCIPAADRPTVYRIEHGPGIAAGGSGQVIAQTAGEGFVGAIRYWKYASDQDAEFAAAYRNLSGLQYPEIVTALRALAKDRIGPSDLGALTDELVAAVEVDDSVARHAYDVAGVLRALSGALWDTPCSGDDGARVRRLATAIDAVAARGDARALQGPHLKAFLELSEMVRRSGPVRLVPKADSDRDGNVCECIQNKNVDEVVASEIAPGSPYTDFFVFAANNARELAASAERAAKMGPLLNALNRAAAGFAAIAKRTTDPQLRSLASRWFEDARNSLTEVADREVDPDALDEARSNVKDELKAYEYERDFMSRLADEFGECFQKTVGVELSRPIEQPPSDSPPMTNIDKVRWAETIEMAVGLGWAKPDRSVISRVLDQYPFVIERVAESLAEGVEKTVGYRAVFRLTYDYGYETVQAFVAGAKPEGFDLLRRAVEEANDRAVRCGELLTGMEFRDMSFYRELESAGCAMRRAEFEEGELAEHAIVQRLPYEWNRVVVEATAGAAPAP